MNTGFLGPAVATVLTACGIETSKYQYAISSGNLLQQYLPLAVLKQSVSISLLINLFQYVATVLTACGIETLP